MNIFAGLFYVQGIISEAEYFSAQNIFLIGYLAVVGCCKLVGGPRGDVAYTLLVDACNFMTV